MKKLYLLLILLCFSQLVKSQDNGRGPDVNGILYVDSAATGDAGGDSWKNAIPQLAVALSVADSINRVHAGSVKQIWVAKGTYKPMFSAQDGHRTEDGGRNNAFVLIKDVDLLGGFAGTETSLQQRDTSKLFTDNRTVLSGEAGKKNDLSDNIFHVVVAADNIGQAKLSGFVVTGGNADSHASIKTNRLTIDNNRGGGMFIYISNPLLSHCIFTRNNAEEGGGLYLGSSYGMKITHCTFLLNTAVRGAGMFNYSSGALPVERSTFSKNIAQQEGGAIYNQAGLPYYRYSDFLDNEAQDGAAIYNKIASLSQPSINCKFLGNIAGHNGGALYEVNTNVVYINCVFAGNRADDWGGGVYVNKSSSQFISCLLSGNKANYGGAFNIDNGSKPTIYNCTISGNQAGKDFGASGSIRVYQSSPVIRNSILWNNSSGIGYTESSLDIKYSLVQSDDVAGLSESNVRQDPLFVRPVSYTEAPTVKGDYKVRDKSPVVDMGTNQLPGGSFFDVDLAGQARISGTHPDAGAYEVQKGSPDAKGILYVNINVSGGNGSGNSWVNAVKELSDALLLARQLNAVHPGTVKQIWVAKGTYHPLYSAEDGHRRENHTGAYNGGFFPTNNAFVLLDHVKLYGGFNGTETSLDQRSTDERLLKENKTVLDGKNGIFSLEKISRHVVIAANVDSAVLDGFVIQNGNAAGASLSTSTVTIKVNGFPPVDFFQGAGIYGQNSSLIVRHCNFSDNSSVGNGGAIFCNETALTVADCHFVDNSAKNKGGAIYCNESAFNIVDCQFVDNAVERKGGAIAIKDETGHASSISNSVFKSNRTLGIKGDDADDNTEQLGGGGIYNHSATPLHIQNSTFSGNNTPTDLFYQNGGAIVNFASSPVIVNCTFEENISAYGGAIYNKESLPIIKNCVFSHNEAQYKDARGGAIYNSDYSDATIINSVFKHNKSRLDGGAIMNADHSSPDVLGCLFFMNDAGNSGHAMYNIDNSSPAIINCTISAVGREDNPHNALTNKTNCDPVIINSIIWGNPRSIWHDDDSSPKVSYSIIQTEKGVYKGDGNMNKNPMFMAPGDSNFRLSQSSPAVATGSNSVAQYHLPDVDLAGNPRVVNGKINIGAYASTFVRPDGLTAVYNDTNTVTVSWKAILSAGEAYVGGDNFKLERATDSTFKANVKTITSSYAYDPETSNYSVTDDVTDVRGGLRLYYRLTRTMAQNQDWAQPAKTSVGVTIDTMLVGGQATLVSSAGQTPKAKVTWEPFYGVWVDGTQFTLKKFNRTDGTQESISIDEEDARKGFYIDENIPTCKEIKYVVSLSLGNNFSSPPDSAVSGSILTRELASVGNLTASKGYFPDRTSLRWTTTGTYDKYIVSRKVYGTSDKDFIQVATVDGTGLKKLTADDNKGTPGVYYQYAVTGLAQCSDATLYSDTVTAIGFRSPTGTVYGRITYEKGGGAVRDATVRMESQGNTQLGKSLYLDGQHGSGLVIDSLHQSVSDSAFTFEAWIKPDDAPKNQVIFDNPGLYSLGFNSEGQMYFDYHGDRVTGDFKDTAAFTHVAVTHDHDSVWIIQDDSVIAAAIVPFHPGRTGSPQLLIGTNSDRNANFKGYLDEVRVWNKALRDSQIIKDDARLLTGGESGLLAYWRFDAAIQGQFYDLSHSGDAYHRNDGIMDAQHVQHSAVIPTTDQLSLKAFTDSTGNYIITGIPYAGINGTIYSIAPKLGTHLFDPVAVTRIFSSGSSEFTLDFKDKSSYIVSGYVTYSGTTVPVKDVNFKIDGQYAFDGSGGLATTNDEGYFAISVPVGEHEVRAVKASHIFVNDGKIIDVDGNNFNYQHAMANVQIRDSTRVRFIGRVAGGAIQTDYPLGFSLSKNNLGSVIKIKLELKSSGNYKLNDGDRPAFEHYRHLIFTDSAGAGKVWLDDSTRVDYDAYSLTIYPDSTTGEFEAELIPADFKVTAVTVEGSPYKILKAPFELNLTDSVIERQHILKREDSVFNAATGLWGNYSTYHDTVKYNASHIFSYRRDPVITVHQTATAVNDIPVSYFGDTTFTFTPLAGDKTIIPLYDKTKGQYTFEHPVFSENVQYGMQITSYEQYVYHYPDGSTRDTDYVPSSGGLVQINNGLKAASGIPDTVKISGDGTAHYIFYPGQPELADGIGLKGFSVNVQIGRQNYQWNNGDMFMAYVFGGRQTGTDFITTGPSRLIGVLRDPPGSDSYSFLQQGSTITTSTTISTEHVQEGTEAATIMAGMEATISTGAPTFMVGQKVTAINKATLTFSHAEHWDAHNTTTHSITFNSGYKTSSEPRFDGADEDTYIGYSTNITYGSSLNLHAVPNDKVRTSDVPFWKGKDYTIVKRTGIYIGQEFNTLFVYPAYHIENYLLPNLEKLRDDILSRGSAVSDPQATADATHQEIYVSKLSPGEPNYGTSNADSSVWGNNASGADEVKDGPSYTIYFPEFDESGKKFEDKMDSILLLNQQIDQWKFWLAKNEKQKVNATYDDNYSFGSGASIDYSEQTANEQSGTASFTFILGGDVLAKAGGTFAGLGGYVTINEGYSYHHDSTAVDSKDSTTTIGYHLQENGSNYMSVDVGTASDGFFVFRTKGGVTSCPYEQGTVTKYYNPGTPLNQPTVQREMPQITVDKPVVSGIAANRAASYTIHLQNASSVKGDIYFGLNVIDKSNPYGAKIYLDGYPLGAGREILIPAGEKLTKTVTLEKGPDSMDYNNIQLVFHSTCQYNPVIYKQNIADTISISAHFLPACSDIHLSSPSDQWLINTGSLTNQEGEPYLPVVLDQYDLDKNLLNHIALQYKASSSPEWTTVMKFYTDSSTYNKDKQGGNKQVIQSPKEVTYNLIMDHNYTDGQYDIRALSVCMDNGQVIAQTPSNIVAGVKDTYTPRLFGNPQPANGILGIGDDVKLKFNEPLDIGFLNHNNFTVRTIKNGSAIDSLVSITLDGEKDYAITEFEKNMTGKDFTVAMWFMPDRRAGGTLFSQGNQNEMIELSLTPDYRLQATVGGKTIQSDEAIDYLPGQWVHVALEYRAADSVVNVFYNFDKVIKEVTTRRYAGVGPLAFGKSLKRDADFFAGKMRNVRIWTRNLSSIELQKNSSVLLSGGENELLACYPMSKGKGGILRDIAHGNNATFNGEWKMPEGRSVALDGKGYVRLNTSQAVITPEMDFTLSLWFKAQPGQTNATLISSGKGDGEDLGGSRNLYALGFEKGQLTFNNNSLKVQVAGDYLDNSWHQVVIAANRNTGTAQFYVDGQLKKFFDANSLGGLAATFTYLGARAYHKAPDSTVTRFDRYFKGKIDEVRIWNTYLNSTLVTEKDNIKLTGEETGLLAYYPFETHINYNGIWTTNFTTEDQKVQNDPNNHIPAAVLSAASESQEKAPMKDPGPKVDLRYDFVVNRDAIVFNFTGGQEEMKAIDKTIVTFTAEDIKDMHGNMLVSPITWTAYIDQNPLDWSDETLNLTKAVNKPMQFESYVINSGGSEETFRISNLPPWLTADVMSGTVSPEGKQKITFTINQGLNVGSYDNIIEMTNDLQETQGLALNLKVTGNTPGWKVNPADFPYSMTVYGKLRVDNIFSDNPEDMLAAFIGGRCVGVAYNTYIKENDFWYVFLTIYSDSLQTDNLSFRIWNAGNGKIYTGIPASSLVFKNGSVAGAPRTPVLFDGRELMIENIPLQKGWNWLSFNLYNNKIGDLNAMLANGSWQAGDMVKNALKGFDGFSTTEGWVGTLPQGAELDNLSLYKLKTGVHQTLSIEGTPLDVKRTPIPLRGGQWNYISYLPLDNMTVEEALAGYEARDGDQIKSQTGFAMYDNQLGWVGNLTYLEPGKGYMLYRTAPSNTTFTYPVSSGILRLSAPDRLNSARLNPYQLPVAKNFYFSDNMTVVAGVDKAFHLLPEDEVLAFAGNALRAKAKAMTNPATGKPLLLFNIPGSTAQLLHFEVERNGRVVARTGAVMSYRSGNRIGSLKQPFMLYFGRQQLSVGVFPDPFHDKLTISLHLPLGAHKVRLRVYNLQGQLVFARSPETVSGKAHILYWNGRSNSGTVCDPGVYIIRLLIDKKPLVYKVIKY